MKTVFQILLSFLPSFLGVPIRKLLGQKIGYGTKIKYGSILLSSDISIGKNTTIGPFCILKAKTLSIGNATQIKPFSFSSARIINIHHYVQIAPLSMITGDWTPKSSIEVGDHSRIFPFCWIDAGEGVKIGKHVGIGGHTLIFTHGVWSNYLNGGPVTFAPVEIKDNVWLPWRVFIMPGVTIGENTIIGANAVVTKSIPDNTLAAGSPAKVIKENVIQQPDSIQQKQMAEKILYEFVAYYPERNFKVEEQKIVTPYGIISLNIEDKNAQNLIFIPQYDSSFEAQQNSLTEHCNIIYHPQLTAFISNPNELSKIFIPFLRRYGIRLYIHQ